jgi:hypothetical protein
VDIPKFRSKQAGQFRVFCQLGNTVDCWSNMLVSGKLFGKKLGYILEGLKLQCIAGGVEEKHSGLFAWQSFEADIGFDDEADGVFPQAFFQEVPVVPFQHDAIVGNRDIVAVDGIGVQAFFGFRPGFKVDDELMAVEIEVHPGVGASAFFATKDIAIELSCFREIVDGDGDVKGGELFHFFVLSRENTKEFLFLPTFDK